MSEKTKARFTPGPWEHEDGEISAQGLVVAEVMGADDFPCCEEEIDEECKANATLIAAAPRLYEALTEVLDVCVYSSKLGWDRTVAKAEAALREADGQ